LNWYSVVAGSSGYLDRVRERFRKTNRIRLLEPYKVVNRMASTATTRLIPGDGYHGARCHVQNFKILKIAVGDFPTTADDSPEVTRENQPNSHSVERMDHAKSQLRRQCDFGANPETAFIYIVSNGPAPQVVFVSTSKAR